jgi:hypothetical protein
MSPAEVRWKADGQASFTLRGYVFDIDEAFNRQAPFVLKWRVPNPPHVRPKAVDGLLVPMHRRRACGSRSRCGENCQPWAKIRRGAGTALAAPLAPATAESELPAVIAGRS